MRTRSFQLLATTAALALALPAVAVSADDRTEGSDVEFSVQTSEFLTISVATSDTTTLTDGGGLLDIGGGTVSGNLPLTTVTDHRSGLSRTSQVNISGSDFVHEDYVEGDSGPAGDSALLVPASAGTATADLTSSVGNLLDGGVTIPSGGVNLGDGGTLVSATILLGNASYSYTPTISVEVPETAPAGTYAGTVTQTVS